jgi:UDP-N-acetylmuramate--alanine ligase
MDFTPEGRRIHMVGIGGAGMSSMALHLKERGAMVTGFDDKGSSVLKELESRGIRIFNDRASRRGVPSDTEFLVHTAAVSDEDPHLVSARRRGVEVVKYAGMLERLMSPYTGIAVAGTHGKTSVSALCAWLLKAAGKSPSYVIGGYVEDLKGGGGAGRGEYFVVEACEFDRSFLKLRPDWAVITNLEPDHLDYFGSFDSLRSAFEEFIEGLAGRKGRLIIWDETVETLNPRRFEGLETWTYGFGDGADLRVADFGHEDGCAHFSLVHHGEALGRFMLRTPGRHNVLNAAAASMVALKLGIRLERLQAALGSFHGVMRRLEDRGTFGKVRVFSDYAHHPTEVRAVLETLRNLYPTSRLVVAYQGHQLWRTNFFMKEFVRTFAGFDLALFLKTFSVREKETKHLPDGEVLAAEVEKAGGRAVYIGDLERAPTSMLSHIREGDLLVLMGAGNIDELSGKITQALSRH